ncbi:MAG: hypothetical protein IJG45_07230 [Oscillospiraceae bacterium]|nr:hypothetical protein [Oscillospiraceae bacterium]
MSMNFYNAGAIAGVVVVVWLAAFGWTIVNYVLRSLSLYTVAKRRGSPNPGLAWVPMIWVWTLGGICDQYDNKLGIKRKWRVALLTLTVVGYVAMIIAYIIIIAQMAGLAFSQRFNSYDYYNYNYSLPVEVIGALGGSIAVMVVGALAAAAAGVLRWICLFKFFESCRPKDALKFMLLSILVPFAQPICMMCSRNYDHDVHQPQFFAPQPPQYYPPQPPMSDNQTPPPYNPYH